MLKLNKNRNFKKADKGTALTVMEKEKVKIQDGPVQINDPINYKPDVNNPAPNVFPQVTWDQS